MYQKGGDMGIGGVLTCVLGMMLACEKNQQRYLLNVMPFTEMFSGFFLVNSCADDLGAIDGAVH